MNLLWLEDFLAVAATGNFSRAAEDRHCSQPAFSRRIRALESWVGVELLDRSSQPAELTEAGEWFRTVPTDILARVARVPEEAQRLAEANSATLRLAATHALSFTFLPRWLRSLESNTPLGPVQLMSDVLQRCEALMLNGKVQFLLSHAHAAAHGVLDSAPFTSTQIGTDVLLPLSVADGQGNAMHPLRDEAGHVVPILRYSDESGLGRIMHALLDRRLDQFTNRTVFTAHLASVLRPMVLDGRGIAWLPKTLVEDDLRSGALAPAAGPEWSIPVAIKLYRDDKFLGSSAERLWQMLNTG